MANVRPTVQGINAVLSVEFTRGTGGLGDATNMGGMPWSMDPLGFHLPHRDFTRSDRDRCGGRETTTRHSYLFNWRGLRLERVAPICLHYSVANLSH